MKIGKYLLLAVGITAVLIVARVVYLSKELPSYQEVDSHRKSAELMFQDYSNALIARDFQRAFGFCSDDFKAVSPFEAFVQQQKLWEAQSGRLGGVKVTAMEVHGTGDPPQWTAFIAADFKYQDKTVHVLYSLDFQDEKWAVRHYERKK